MNKSRTARLVGFLGALGASAALVGTAVHGTGAYFSDSHDGSISASIGHVRVSTSNTTLDFARLLPGEYQQQHITYSTDTTGKSDVWLVFPGGDTDEFIHTPVQDSPYPLGRYGHLAVYNDGSQRFVSNNLSLDPNGYNTSASCYTDSFTGWGGSNDLATSTDRTDPGSVVKYCSPRNAILLASNVDNGYAGDAVIEFGFTRVLKSLANSPDAPIENFKIVATQHGVSPLDRNNGQD